MKEQDLIASAFAEIGKIFCELAKKLNEMEPLEPKDQLLFDQSNTRECVGKISFRHQIQVKYVGMRWKTYRNIKEFYEDVSGVRQRGNRIPMCMNVRYKDYQDAANILRIDMERVLQKFNDPRKIEKIARIAFDGKRYEA